MITYNNPLLQTLVGKTVAKVVYHTSHGEVVDIIFTDGTKLQYCVNESIYHRDELQTFIDGEEL
jgi:hypothetical protein